MDAAGDAGDNFTVYVALSPALAVQDPSGER
jgi:hypothetical protein